MGWVGLGEEKWTHVHLWLYAVKAKRRFIAPSTNKNVAWRYPEIE